MNIGFREPWKVILPVMIALLFTVASFGTAQAVEFIDDDNIPAGTTIDDDVFIGGNNVTIDGTVTGDVFAFGSSVELNGEVQGSFVSAAQFVTINGTVNGSAYVGGSNIELGPSAAINRNIYVGGYAFESATGSKVGRDFLMGGFQAILNGEIGEDLMIGSGALELNGSVGGNVRADIGDPTEQVPFMQFYSPPGAPAAIPMGIRIAEDAEIGGELTYTSQTSQADAIQAQPAGGVIFNTPMPDEVSADTGDGAGSTDDAGGVAFTFGIGKWLLERARQFVTLLVLGALVLWLLPDLFRKTVEKTRQEPLPATLWGFLTLIVGYAGAVVIAGLVLGIGILFSIITFGGLGRTVFGVGFASLGFVFTLFVLMVSYGSKLIVSFFVGKWIVEKVAPTASDSKIWPLLVGVLIYVILRAIPIFGWLIGIIATLIGLGAAYLVVKDLRTAPTLETA